MPNRLMQKLLRELDLIQLAVSLLELPFKKGVDIEQIKEHQEVRKQVFYMNICVYLRD